MFQIHAVFHQFDDGEQKFGISQPTEDVLEGAEVFVLHATGNAVAEGCQYDDGRCGVVLLDVSGDVEHRVVFGGWHDDDEVYLSSCHLCGGFFLAVHLKEAWWEAKSEFCILREDFLVHSSVVFKHEGIVGVGNEKHVAHAVEHEVNEGCVFQRHNRSGHIFVPKLRIIPEIAKHFSC